MSVTISDEFLQSARISEAEFMREISLMLFQKEKLTLAQAARLAQMDRLAFQHLLASREIPVHYDTAELERDMKTLESLDQ